MKGNIKRLAVLVIITVIATFMMAATVTAESRNHRFIQGQYAATGSATCLVAFYGFTNLVPNPVPDPPTGPPFVYQLVTCSTEGVFTFHRDGTGHGERPNGPCVIVSGVPDAPFAANSQDSWDFTYEVGRDGSITLTQEPGTHSGSFTSGPVAGFTFGNENRDWHGTVSPDGKTIILNAGLPDIITTVGSPEGLVCNASLVLIWQHDIDHKR